MKETIEVEDDEIAITYEAETPEDEAELKELALDILYGRVRDGITLDEWRAGRA
uniref:hypothetical protein n=1 Tax=Herbidospora sakaeratensis TaxID=564415 RepID=UPI000A96A1E4|nr:hypothetical protein [Herbidospora sakaeratensis]